MAEENRRPNPYTYDDDDDDDDNDDLADRGVREHNPYASSNRWRHQESTAFSKYAGLSATPKTVREADAHGGVADLANFLNSSRIEHQSAQINRPKTPTHRPIIVNGHANVDADTGAGIDATGKAQGPYTDGGVEWEKEGLHSGRHSDGKEVRCGPLINYRRMEGTTWHGSVLIVVRGGIPIDTFAPELVLRKAETTDRSNEASYSMKGTSGANGGLAVNDTGRNGGYSKQITSDGNATSSGEEKVKGVKLYSDLRNIFWRFSLVVQMTDKDTEWTYQIPGLRFPDELGKTDKQSFWVPAVSESMRIMFHSCNGFSVGTDEDAWSGAALWNDVQRVHKETPLHVMIGGGDQIYNDGVRVNGPLRPWSDIPNPTKRRETKFPETLRKQCDDYYVANYIRWYSTEPFAGANGMIPQLNQWDDHDIIDGFGSYVHNFMKCDIFRGIGGTAYKYYMLFQHHLPPPVSTYTTDAPQTMELGPNGTAADPAQLNNSYVLQGVQEEPSYIIGKRPGPYVAEHSRSIYARLGARMAFFGIDARTERTRHQVNYPETYDLIFSRLRKELGAAKNSTSPIQHLIVLLGIPIAYPRLTWLENILQSPLIGPIKFLNRRFGIAAGLFNKFDGSVDLLDDLDDHYTARTHKKERLQLVLDLQNLAAEFSVRVTILGGDVHLAAIGRFYSNPKLGIPTIRDHRYMANIISSAIVNKPPPAAVANLLARRNKLHHLDADTDETLLRTFDRDPGDETRTASSNHVTMPSRNWAILTENSASFNIHHINSGTPNPENSDHNINTPSLSLDQCSGKDGHFPLHPGEENAGSTNRAVLTHGQKGDGSLDICIRVERDQHDRHGLTRSYGFWIPALRYDGAADEHVRKRDAFKHDHGMARSSYTSHSVQTGNSDAGAGSV